MVINMDIMPERIIELIGERHGASKELADAIGIHPARITDCIAGRLICFLLCTLTKSAYNPTVILVHFYVCHFVPLSGLSAWRVMLALFG